MTWFILFLFLCLPAHKLWAEELTREFNLPAQNLRQALQQFAEMADLDLLYLGRLPEQATSEPLAGLYTSPDALAHLMRGSGYRALYTTEYAITIEYIPTVTVVGRMISPYRLNVSSISTKTQRDFLSTPQAVTVIANDFLTDTAARDYTDVLQRTSGVSFLESSAGVNRELRLRGFAFPALKINGYSSHAYTIAPDVDLVERIEVAKGPSSVLFGRMEPGGVVNLMLKAPERDVGEVSLRQGNDNYQRLGVDLGDVEDDWGWRLTGFKQQQGSLSDFDLDDNEGLLIALQYQWPEGSILKGYHRYEERDAAQNFGVAHKTLNEFVIDFGEGDVVPAEELDFDTKTRYRLKLNSSLLSIEDLSLGDWAINANFQYDQYRVQHQLSLLAQQEVGDLPLDISPDQLAAAQSNKAEFYSGELIARRSYWINDQQFEYLYGLHFARSHPDQLIWQTHDIRGSFNIDPPFVDIAGEDISLDVEENNLALFAQWIVPLSSQHTLFAGWRRDRLAAKSINNDDPFSQTDYETSARLGWVYHHSDVSSVYLNISKAFTPQFSREQTADFTVPNPAHSRQWEIGLKNEWWGGGLQSTLALFEIKKTDIAAEVESQRNRGVELDIVGKLANHWDVTFGLSYMDAEITQAASPEFVGNKPRVTPDYMADIWLQYHKHLASQDELRWGVGLEAVGRRYGDDDNSFELDAYERIDMAFSYHWQDKLLLTVTIKNLLDSEYDNGVFNNWPYWVNPGHHRTIESGINYHW